MRRTLSVAAVVAALALSSSEAEAWWCTGHMTVAEIAKQKMEQSSEGKAALENVQSLISEFSSNGPFPKIPDMTQAGCWADDVKAGLDKLTADWHFLNLPYDPTNYPIAHPPGQKETVDVVLNQLDEALKEHPVYWEKSFALALMIHFYGDIHQPLHVTELFSSDYPNGDYGGNLIDVYVNESVKMNLHAVWDSLCGYYTSDPNRPLDSDGQALISGLAQNFVQMHSGITPSEASEWNTTKMAQEGYQLAIQYAYDNGNIVSSGAQLSSSYISNCFSTASRRVALAGLRLASELTYVFKKKDWKSVTAEELHGRVRKAKLDILHSAENGHKELRAKQAKH